MEIFGLNFAPIFIPFERRLQTFAVLFWITLFLFVGPLITILLVCLLMTSYWWITILYMTWVFFDWKTPFKGGRKSDFLYVRRWSIWQFFRNFFPIELVKTVDLNPNKTYLFGSHPHGLGTYRSYNTKALVGLDGDQKIAIFAYFQHQKYAYVRGGRGVKKPKFVIT